MSTTTTETYCIKPGYRPNGVPVTMDVVTQGTYWDPHRIASARYYQFGVYERAARLIRTNGLASLVDVGCGVGMKLAWLHERLPEVRVVGIDQPHAVEFCRSHHPWGTWIVDDFERPSPEFAEVRGDLVICADVIEHLMDPDLLLRYLRQRLAPGGRVLLSTPERDLVRGEDCQHSPNPAHVREWNRSELARYLTSRGFRILEHSLDYAVKMGLNAFAWQEIRSNLLRGRTLRYNQVCLFEVA
jgi:SAM-dependent methyltransferase